MASKGTSAEWSGLAGGFNFTSKSLKLLWFGACFHPCHAGSSCLLRPVRRHNASQRVPFLCNGFCAALRHHVARCLHRMTLFCNIFCAATIAIRLIIVVVWELAWSCTAEPLHLYTRPVRHHFASSHRMPFLCNRFCATL